MREFLIALREGNCRRFNWLRKKNCELTELWGAETQTDSWEVSGLRLKRFKLDGMFFKNIHFVTCNFAGTSLVGTNFEDCVLKQCVFRDNRFNESGLNGTLVSDCVLENISFEGADVSGAVFEKSTFRRCDFSGLKHAFQAIWEVDVDSEEQVVLLRQLQSEGIQLLEKRSRVKTHITK